MIELLSQSMYHIINNTKMASQQNTEFLLGLLLEENKYLFPIDFINQQNESFKFGCVCVSFAIAEKVDLLREKLKLSESFMEEYFNIYASALDNYRAIVGESSRQTLVDEVKIFHSLDLTTYSTTKLVSNLDNKTIALGLLDKINKTHSYMIVLRDEIAFVVIHYQNDEYIIIDPHVEYCGVLSKGGIYRYVVYDSIWDNEVHVMIPNIIGSTD